MNITKILLSLSHDVRLRDVSVNKVLNALRSNVTTRVVGTYVACSNPDWYIICTNNDIYGDKCIGYPCYEGATGKLNVFQKTIVIGNANLALINKGQWKEADIIYRD